MHVLLPTSPRNAMLHFCCTSALATRSARHGRYAGPLSFVDHFGSLFCLSPLMPLKVAAMARSGSHVASESVSFHQCVLIPKRKSFACPSCRRHGGHGHTSGVLAAGTDSPWQSCGFREREKHIPPSLHSAQVAVATGSADMLLRICRCHPFLSSTQDEIPKVFSSSSCCLLQRIED